MDSCWSNEWMWIIITTIFLSSSSSLLILFCPNTEKKNNNNVLGFIFKFIIIISPHPFCFLIHQCLLENTLCWDLFLLFFSSYLKYTKQNRGREGVTKENVKGEKIHWTTCNRCLYFYSSFFFWKFQFTNTFTHTHTLTEDLAPNGLAFFLFLLTILAMAISFMSVFGANF